MECKYLKIAIFTPLSHAKEVRDALAKAGAGNIGDYEYCSFSVRGVGRFRPKKNAKPFVGEIGAIEEVEEERIETILPSKNLKAVLAAVKAAHPYEEPAIDIYPLLN